MGDDRPEMEGFRFWKSGYWKRELIAEQSGLESTTDRPTDPQSTSNRILTISAPCTSSILTASDV